MPGEVKRVRGETIPPSIQLCIGGIEPVEGRET